MGRWIYHLPLTLLEFDLLGGFKHHIVQDKLSVAFFRYVLPLPF